MKAYARKEEVRRRHIAGYGRPFLRQRGDGPRLPRNRAICEKAGEDSGGKTQHRIEEPWHMPGEGVPIGSVADEAVPQRATFIVLRPLRFDETSPRPPSQHAGRTRHDRMAAA